MPATSEDAGQPSPSEGDGNESGPWQPSGASATGTAPRLHEHSNANLLKIDTHDSYSTVSAIKRYIVKSLGLQPPKDTAMQTPLLRGVLRINKNPKSPHLYLAFDSAEDRAAALAMLQSISYRGRPWCEVPVTTHDLQFTHKGGWRVDRQTADLKRSREPATSPRVPEPSKVAQYVGLPMSEQHSRKEQHCLSVLRALLPPARACGAGAHHACFAGLISSPRSDGYRNHVNLTFGYDAAGSPTLGFNTGAIVEGKFTVDSAIDCEAPVATMSSLATLVATAVMTEVCAVFFDESAGALRVMDRHTGTGFWRRLQIRHNVHGEVLLDVELDPTGVDEAVLEKVLRLLVQACTAPTLTARLRAASGLPQASVVSLQYHTHHGIGGVPGDAPRVLLYGDSATLTERLCGLQFELSPTSFFQVNTPAMECLLEKLRCVAELRPSTTLLDLCCGAGTIGLALARHVRRVIGIELVESAVLNARANATRNGVSNATFHCGRVEQLLPTVLQSLPQEERGAAGDLVAVVDPPRAGVSSAVLKWIRGTAGIRRVVYISCEQKALLRDCPHLTKPSTKAYRGMPFVLTTAFAVDMFPHTPHVEMIVVLARTCEDAQPGSDDAAPTLLSENDTPDVAEGDRAV